jgi:hypothetical protein
MADYMVETYLSRVRTSDLEGAAARARAAARELADGGVPVSQLRSVFLSEDEICLHFFRAASIEDVQEVLERAGLGFDRIDPAVTAGDGREEGG